MMKKTLLKAGFVLALLAAPVAYAAGLFPSFPIQNGAAYCVSNNANTGTCTQTVPAGPTGQLTGNETFPADTNLSSGRAPQTILVKPGDLSNYAQAIATLTAASNTITPNLVTSRFFTTTLGAGAPGTTIAAPLNPISGQRWSIKLVQDATGSRTVSWNTLYKWPTGGTAPTLTATASRADVFNCIYDGVDHFCSNQGLNYIP